MMSNVCLGFGKFVVLFSRLKTLNFHAFQATSLRHKKQLPFFGQKCTFALFLGITSSPISPFAIHHGTFRRKEIGAHGETHYAM